MIPVKVRTPKGDIVCKTQEEVNNAIALYLKSGSSGSVSIHRIFGECVWPKDCEHRHRDKTSGKGYCGRSAKHEKCGSNIGFNTNVRVVDFRGWQ